MTMDVHGHLFSDRLDEVADALDTARSGCQIRRCCCHSSSPVAKVLPNADVVDLAATRRKANRRCAKFGWRPRQDRTRAPASGGRIR